MLKNDFKKAFELMDWRLELEELNFIPLDTLKPRWDGHNDQNKDWHHSPGDFYASTLMKPRGFIPR